MALPGASEGEHEGPTIHLHQRVTGAAGEKHPPGPGDIVIHHHRKLISLANGWCEPRVAVPEQAQGMAGSQGLQSATGQLVDRIRVKSAVKLVDSHHHTADINQQCCLDKIGLGESRGNNR